MPELPEVEHLRRTLEPHLVGARIRSARINLPAFFSTARPTARQLLQGATIASLDRRGKQLAIIAHDGRVLCIQLGMTGQLLRTPEPPHAPAPNHVHAQWLLHPSPGAASPATFRLLFRDPRRFGCITPLPGPGALADRWSRLGPDALTITADELTPALKHTRRAVKAALLDQTLIAGVGNIYADEALFLAGIRPGTAARRLSGPRISTLAHAIRTVLARAVDAGGSTLRDYRDANGEPGWFVVHHLVYGRSGQPCTRCTAALRKALIAQRTTVYCPHCQR